MSIALIYWVMMLVWLITGLYWSRANLRGFATDSLSLFILFLLIGWRLFGAPVHQ